MLNNVSNTNKTNNYFSHQITEHKKRERDMQMINQDPGLGQVQTWGGDIQVI